MNWKLPEISFLDQPSNNRYVKITYKFLIISLFTFLFFSLFILSMQAYTDHDDFPYYAGAKLMHEEGLLPYKDYRLMHMPYYVFTYALILKGTPVLTMGARIISFLSLYTLLVLIFRSLQKSFADKNQLLSFLVGAAAVLYIIYNPAVKYAHSRFTFDLPLLLSLLAFLLLTTSLEYKRPYLKTYISGILIGVAIGYRLHFILFSFPLALGIVILFKQGWRSNIKHLGYFLAGILTGLIPVLILFIIEPKGFIFDIYQFHFIYEKELLIMQGRIVPFADRVRDLYDQIRDTWQNTVLFFGAIALTCMQLLRIARGKETDLRINLVLITLPFLLYLTIGKVLLYQYLYPLVVFTVLGIFMWLGTLRERANIVTILICSLSITLIVKGEELRFADYQKSEQWRSLRRYECTKHVEQALSKSTRVFTFSPAEVLESDSIQIYKEFVSSPFLFRCTPLIPSQLNEQHSIISKDKLREFLLEQQPDAIFTGYENDKLEKPLVEFARENGYQEVKIPVKHDPVLFVKSGRPNQEVALGLTPDN